MATVTTTPRTRRATEVAGLKRELAAVEGGRKWLWRLLIAAVLAVLVVGVVQWRKAHPPPKAPKYLTEETSTGDVIESIQSTGIVQPVTKVDVGAQISGRVLKRYVDFNSQVKKGDLLLEFDPTIYQSNVAADSARVATASAAVEGDKAGLSLAKTNWDRAVLLNKQGLASDADVVTAKGGYDAALAKLHGSEAQLALSAAALKSSQTNLTYTKIYAPIDGVVLSRSVDVGQTVAASFPAPVLFTLAQDLTHMLVFADVDEADLGRLSKADNPEVEVRVEAFQGESFKGKLQEIRYNATTTQGVVTYPAVIDVANPDLKLRPGMTATVTIRTAVVKAALRVPNAALRYRPSPPMGPDGKPRPVRPEPPPPAGKGRIYVPGPTPDAEPKALVVEIGISDGLFTVIESKSLSPGTKVVVDESDEDADKKKQRGLF